MDPAAVQAILDSQKQMMDQYKDSIKQLMDENKRLQAAVSSSSKNPPTPPVKPRVGGITAIGAWTGYGAKGNPDEPRSAYCYRKVISHDPLKAAVHQTALDTHVKKGLSNHPSGLLFCTPEEPKAKHFVSTVRVLEELAKETGTISVFIIVRQDGPDINLFRSPGEASDDIMKTWIEDLTKNGVLDKSDPLVTKRHPVCEMDKLTLSVSDSQILNSCTEELQQRIKVALPESQSNGPMVMFEVFRKCYAPSHLRVKKLTDQLEAMDIRKYPGENVTSFTADAVDIIREVEMNFITHDQAPTLAMAALKGLTLSSDPMFQQQARKARIKANNMRWETGAQNPPSAIELLNQFDREYRQLVEGDDYAPTRTQSREAANHATIERLQAQISQLQANQAQLQQDRNASSSRGNSGSTQNGHNSSNNGSSNSGTRKCLSCGATDHLKGDPNCPNLGKPLHGLTEEEVAFVNATAKERLASMPPRKNVPDEPVLKIELNGKTLAIYCRHCGRFTKGSSAHTTADHKGKYKIEYAGPADTAAAAPAPAPAPSPSPSPKASVATLPNSGPAPSPSASASPVAKVASLPEAAPKNNLSTLPEGMTPACIPIVENDTFFNGPPATYDFGSMPAFQANLQELGLVPDPDDPDLMWFNLNM